MKNRATVIIIAVFALVSTNHAQKNQDVCRVITDTRSVSEGRGTGIYEVGKFPIDDIENTTERSFRYEWDKQVFLIDVEVEYTDYRDIEKGKPKWLLLSLLARRIEDQNNKSIQPVEARTDYRYKWGTVTLSTHLVMGDLIQHFELMCSDGISKDGVQRGEPKWLKKAKDRKDN